MKLNNIIHEIIKIIGQFASTIIVLFILIDITSEKEYIGESKYIGGLVVYCFLSIMGYLASLHIKINNKL